MRPLNRNRIRQLRRLHDPPLLQRELAAVLRVSQSEVSAWELGKVIPTLETALAIALALESPVEVVFDQLCREAAARVAAGSGGWAVED